LRRPSLFPFLPRTSAGLLLALPSLVCIGRQTGCEKLPAFPPSRLFLAQAGFSFFFLPPPHLQRIPNPCRSRKQLLSGIKKSIVSSTPSLLSPTILPYKECDWNEKVRRIWRLSFPLFFFSSSILTPPFSTRGILYNLSIPFFFFSFSME